ncbi:hypothetical protein HAX54_019317 [Datura stramonium]|uniref:Fe2OG dioxygenase domain-containing protein n=1 Tax=Datura stramonium TaxID=4076 RepID=A0ABS8URA4_DATST|nr:hypothetical protein [Datura stramonium]
MDSVPIVKEIPVLDLGQAQGKERAVVARQILKALEEYGFFQIINHGVPQVLMDEAMKVCQEFFNLPMEEKVHYAKETETLYTSNPKHYVSEEHQYWKEVLEHNCNIDGEDQNTWPSNPPKYREVIGQYSFEVRKLSKIILDLVAEGLGLEAGFFGKEHGQRMFVNHYPVCPDPSLTLGTGGHCDPNLITISQQQVYGLQILKNEEWIGLEPLPHAFVVNFGLPITVISNGKLTSVAHRAVTNTTQSRTAIGIQLSKKRMKRETRTATPPEDTGETPVDRRCLLRRERLATNGSGISTGESLVPIQMVLELTGH